MIFNDMDILVWPDGTWCYRDELEHNRGLGDNYRVLAVETPEYRGFVQWPDKHPGSGF